MGLIWQGITMKKRALNTVVFSLLLYFLGQGQIFAANGQAPVPPNRPMIPPNARPGARMQPGARDAGVSEASTAIEEMLSIFMQAANQTIVLTATDIEDAKETFKQSRRYQPKFTDNQKCRYHMLGAWLNFHLGDMDGALSQAKLAYRSNSSDEDAKSTYAAMAFLSRSYNDIKLLSRGGTKTAPSRNSRGRTYQPAGSGYSKKVLNFDISSVKVEMLEQQIPRL